MSFAVFLSHSAGDQSLVGDLREVAKRIGCDLYVYTDDPQAGRNLADKVKERIEASDVVIVLLTNLSASSGAVQQEVGLALALNKPIIPVKAKGLNHRTLGFLLDREWIELDPADQAGALAGIQHSLARYKSIVDAQVVILVLLLTAILIGWLLTNGSPRASRQALRGPV